MDADEYAYIKSDWSTYNDDEIECSDTCIYCGKESDNLNIVYYEYHQEECKVNIVATNPKPHEKIKWTNGEGWIRRHEYVCDECMQYEEDA